MAAASVGGEPAVGDEDVHVGHVAEAGEVLLAVLGGVGEQHHAPGGADRGPLDGGLGEVGGGQAVGDAEAVGAEEDDVGADLAVGAQRPGVDGGPGAVADPAADEVEVDGGVVGEPGGDGQGVGDEGEPAVQGQLGGEPGDGRSGVEDDAALGGEFGERGPRDAVLLVGGGGLALGEVGLEVEPPGRDGAAVHPAHQAGPVECLQIAPYGLGGDLEGLGEREHVHAPALPRDPQDLLLPLRCVHVCLRPFPCPNLWLRPPGYAVSRFADVNVPGTRASTNGPGLPGISPSGATAPGVR